MSDGPGKAPPPATRAQTSGEPSEASPRKYLAVVRRGEVEVYRLLKEYLEARGLVRVIWDRRTADRRVAGARRPRERRRVERRHPRPEISSRTLGFFLTRPAEPAPQSSRRRR